MAEDRRTNLIFPANQGSDEASLEQDLRTAFVRYRRDVGETSTLGVLYTGRDGSGYENQVLGVDGALRVTDSDVIRFQALGSRTEYPAQVAADHGQPEGSFDGSAWLVDYRHGERDWAWFATYQDLDPDFRADAGFLPQVDVRAADAGVERTFWGEPGDWYRRLEVFLGADTTRSHAGDVEEWGADLVVTWQGPWQSVVSASVAPNGEHFDGVDYDNFRQSVFASLRPSGAVALSGRVSWGETIDFANSRQADFVSIQPEIELNLGRRFRGELDHVWEELEVAPGRLLTARLTRARLYYHLNRRTFVRAILQHRDVDRNAAVYREPVEPEVEQLLSQLLFSYEVNPRTVVLAGYSDDRLGLRGTDLTRTGRTFFLKLGYAWLL